MSKKIDLGGNTFAERAEDGIRIYYEKKSQYQAGPLTIDLTRGTEIIKIDAATLKRIVDLMLEGNNAG